MLYSRVAHGDSIELGCGISRLGLGSAPEARASAPVGPMSSDSYDNYNDPNLNTLSSALPGSYPDFPMVAPGLSGPRYRPPSTADRQATLPSAKKELAKAQPWRVDEWREFRFFERALRRYLLVVTAPSGGPCWPRDKSRAGVKESVAKKPHVAKRGNPCGTTQATASAFALGAT